jgi:hypothetical protein
MHTAHRLSDDDDSKYFAIVDTTACSTSSSHCRRNDTSETSSDTSISRRRIKAHKYKSSCASSRKRHKNPVSPDTITPTLASYVVSNASSAKTTHATERITSRNMISIPIGVDGDMAKCRFAIGDFVYIEGNVCDGNGKRMPTSNTGFQMPLSTPSARDSNSGQYDAERQRCNTLYGIIVDLCYDSIAKSGRVRIRRLVHASCVCDAPRIATTTIVNGPPAMCLSNRVVVITNSETVLRIRPLKVTFIWDGAALPQELGGEAASPSSSRSSSPAQQTPQLAESPVSGDGMGLQCVAFIVGVYAKYVPSKVRSSRKNDAHITVRSLATELASGTFEFVDVSAMKDARKYLAEHWFFGIPPAARLPSEMALFRMDDVGECNTHDASSSLRSGNADSCCKPSSNRGGDHDNNAQQPPPPQSQTSSESPPIVQCGDSTERTTFLDAGAATATCDRADTAANMHADNCDGVYEKVACANAHITALATTVGWLLKNGHREEAKSCIENTLSLQRLMCCKQ